MKIHRRISIITALSIAILTISCNDFLDREPLDTLTPSQFFNTENDLAAYMINQYGFGTYSGYGLSILKNDDGSDNQAASTASLATWIPGEKKTAETGGAWGFGTVRALNYFLSEVLPKYEAGAIKGNIANIRHYIGEAYFLRASSNFGSLVSLGDFPIITTVLPDEVPALVEASKRSPRNVVARFILSDLDKAIEMMSNNPSGGKNRLTKNAALLLKSRVALFEGTWLKYHAGTARVPGGLGWPGAKMDYNSGFTINLQEESKWFLQQAMEAAAAVADIITLTSNSGVFNPPVDANNRGTGVEWNPYFEMFSATDMSSYSEVLFWRTYSFSLPSTALHSVSFYMITGGDSGFTRGLIDAYPMKNGLPIYAAGSGYAGDLSIESVKQERDERLQLFVAAPSDIARLDNPATGVTFKKFDAPTILNPTATRMVTGYASRKCLTYDPQQIGKGSGLIQTYGCLLYRGVEAHLNYMEACYELNGSLDSKADSYWKAIRRRAGVNEDYNVTISATDLSKENDWAKYSGAVMVDATLFNIRRERRIELMQEGGRMRDLKRWRALDHVEGYQIEGFNLWGSGANQELYKVDGKSLLIPQGSTGTANVSGKAESGDYLRPYQIVKANNPAFYGYTWSMANYLEPIAIQHIRLTASDPNDLTTSVIYQNPGWSLVSGEPASDY